MYYNIYNKQVGPTNNYVYRLFIDINDLLPVNYILYIYLICNLIYW